MKCFYHTDLDAVGTCKSCSKGLCPECAVDLGKGLACEGCKQDVLDLIATIDRSVKVSTSHVNIRKNGIAQAAFLGIPGITFLGWGLLDGQTFLAILGASFLGYALYVIWRTITFPKIES